MQRSRYEQFFAIAFKRMKKVRFWELIPDLTQGELFLLAAIAGAGRKDIEHAGEISAEAAPVTMEETTGAAIPLAASPTAGGSCGAMKVSDLCAVCGMKPSAASRLLNSLEEKGLIERSLRKGDRRITDVRLTEKGAETSLRNRQIMHSFWSEVFEAVSPEELDTLLSLWGRILDSIDDVYRRRTQTVYKLMDFKHNIDISKAKQRRK